MTTTATFGAPSRGSARAVPLKNSAAILTRRAYTKKKKLAHPLLLPRFSNRWYTLRVAEVMMTRPPLDQARHIAPMWARGHLFLVGDHYLYPCKGCGCEHGSELAQFDCKKPYQPSETVVEVLLQIRDLLQILVGASRVSR